MKRIMLCSLVLWCVAAQAQKKTPAKKPVAQPAPAPVLKTLKDSVSYAIGLSCVNMYGQQGFEQLNGNLVGRAISDVTAKKKLLLQEDDVNNVLMRYLTGVQEEKSKPNIVAGERFLAANKQRAGVQTTASGLQYEVITKGTGPRPTINDTVLCHYRGTLLDGTEFDNSFKRGEPLSIPVGRVIRGWTEALQLMPAGSKYKLYIPQQLGYGTNSVGAIPGGSTLVFEVELLEVLGKENKSQK